MYRISYSLSWVTVSFFKMVFKLSFMHFSVPLLLSKKIIFANSNGFFINTFSVILFSLFLFKSFFLHKISILLFHFLKQNLYSLSLLFICFIPSVFQFLFFCSYIFKLLLFSRKDSIWFWFCTVIAFESISFVLFIVHCFSKFFKFLLSASLVFFGYLTDFFVKLVYCVLSQPFGHTIFFFRCSTVVSVLLWFDCREIFIFVLLLSGTRCRTLFFFLQILPCCIFSPLDMVNSMGK